MKQSEAKEVYIQNVKEIQKLVFQTDEMNAREVLGKVYFCLKALEILVVDK